MKKEFQEELRQRMIALLDSKRGTQTLLSDTIGEKSSYFSHIKTGNPVNAMHLKAVAIVFGPKKLLELMAAEEPGEEENFKDPTRGRKITKRLLDLERMSPKAFDLIETYIEGAYEVAKATAAKWDGIERRSKERRSETKEDLGFERRKNGTEE